MMKMVRWKHIREREMMETVKWKHIKERDAMRNRCRDVLLKNQAKIKKKAKHQIYEQKKCGVHR